MFGKPRYKSEYKEYKITTIVLDKRWKILKDSDSHKLYKSIDIKKETLRLPIKVLMPLT